MNARIAILISVAAFYPLAVTGSDEAAKSEKSAADPMLGKKLGQVRDDNGLKMKLVWCPPGFVTMEQVEQIEEPVAKDGETDEGDPKPGPRTTTIVTPVKVLLSHGYWLGKYEVTQAEWKQVMATKPWKGKYCTKEGENFPATAVNWHDATEFCRKLTEQECNTGRLPDGWEYTLPTEAQWERACRARTETTFSFGDDESKLGEYAWFGGNATNLGEEYAHPVGQKEPNPWGLHDMHGNVCEWCRDYYSEKLPGRRDPEVSVMASFRVLRGGSWSVDAADCRSGERLWFRPGNSISDVGFRVALSFVR